MAKTFTHIADTSRLAIAIRLLDTAIIILAPRPA